MSQILVADDAARRQHRAFDLLNSRCLGEVAGTKVSEARMHLTAPSPDLMLVGLDGAATDALDLIRQAAALQQPIPVVALIEAGRDDLAAEAIRSGAANYVPETEFDCDLCDIVTRVLQAAERSRRRTRLLECMESSRSCFRIPNDRNMISTILDRLQQSLALFDICNEIHQMHVGIALDEAVSNAMYHGNLEIDSSLKLEDESRFYALAARRTSEAPYCSREIYIEEEFTREEGRFTIRDEGGGFNWAELIDGDDGDLERPCGRGLRLMQAFMDEVTYNSRGNAVTLVKRRCHAPCATDQAVAAV